MKSKVSLVKSVSIFLIVFLSIQVFSISPVKSERVIAWTPLTSGTANYLNDVDFIDNNNGWVTGGTNTILKTTDAGVTWNPVTISGAVSGDGYNSVNFLDLNTGFVSGQKIIARTLDGGSTWVAGRDTNSSNFRSASFPTSSTTLWVVGSIGTNRAYWRYTFNPDNSITTYFFMPISMGYWSDLHFTSVNEGWVVGYTGAIVHITNASGTPSYSGQTSGTSETLNAIQMLDSLHGWVVGNNGVILYTSDGGANWTAKTSGITSPFWDVFFMDSLNGWIVSDTGIILATSDGGETWNPETSGVTANFRGITFSPNGTGYAVGQNGTILKRGQSNAPGSFSKTSPSNGSTGQETSIILSWGVSTGATSYEYCYDESDDDQCSGWVNVGTNLSALIDDLDYSTTYFWHVKAVNTDGTTYSNGSINTDWSFTTKAQPLDHHNFLPLIIKTLPKPLVFSKLTPLNGAIDQSTNPTLRWETSTYATGYEFCITELVGSCTSWQDNGASTSYSLSGLDASTTYYWHVRATNSGGTTYSDGSDAALWSFTTGATPSDPIENGDFESGRVNWTEYSALGNPLILDSDDLPVAPHGGSWAARLGGFDDETSRISQTVIIPPGKSMLHFWYYIQSDDACEFDFFHIYIDSSQEIEWDLCSAYETGSWVEHSIDLSTFEGSSVQLKFEATTDFLLESSIFLDDISFQVTRSITE